MLSVVSEFCMCFWEDNSLKQYYLGVDDVLRIGLFAVGPIR